MKDQVFFLVRAWDAYAFFERCVGSILQQKGNNYTIVYIWDGPKLSSLQRRKMKRMLTGHIIRFNRKRKYSVKNAYEAMHKFIPKDAIVVSLDGDDWLIRDDVVERIRATYQKTQCLVAYGNCVVYAPGSCHHNVVASDIFQGMNTRYPSYMVVTHAYREHPFRPLHLRSWRASLFAKIPKRYFLRPDGSWLQFCEDQAIMFPLLELAKGRYEVFSERMSVYNLVPANADRKIHIRQKLVDEVIIRRKTIQGISEQIQLTDDVSDTCLLSYSSMCKSLFLGRIFYGYQIVLLWMHWTKHIYLGGNDTRLERYIIRLVSQRWKRVLCQTIHLGKTLRAFSSCIVFVGSTDHLGRQYSTDRYEDVLWTLVFICEISYNGRMWCKRNGLPMKALVKGMKTCI